MSCRITELVIDCADPQRLADFWCEVLGFVELGWEGDTHLEIGPPGTGFGGLQPTLLFARSDEPRRGKLPLHFDVNPVDCDQEKELQRLLAAGARQVEVGQGADASWHVLADPEGNEFCLLRRQVAEVE